MKDRLDARALDLGKLVGYRINLLKDKKRTRVPRGQLMRIVMLERHFGDRVGPSNRPKHPPRRTAQTFVYQLVASFDPKLHASRPSDW